MKEVTIYTDGSCSGNPGPGGWAALLQYDSHEKVLSGSTPMTTNNRMELTAALESMRALKTPCRVLLHTDSTYLRNAFTRRWLDRWQQNGWKTASKKPVENIDLWQALLEESARHHVTWIKVRAHADNRNNNRVDQIAVEAMKRQRMGDRVIGHARGGGWSDEARYPLMDSAGDR